MTALLYTFEGKVKWASVFAPAKGKAEFAPAYMISFYPKDAETRKAVKGTGIRAAIKEDEDGEFFYTLRRPVKNRFGEDMGKPEIFTAENEAWSGALIGNGSVVEVTLLVEKFPSKEHGEVTRGTLQSLRILEHVPYVKPEPAEASEAPTPAEAPAATPKKVIPF